MNVVGCWTLLAKETRRFLRMPAQTIAQPVITTTLYFVVFGIAVGDRISVVDGAAYPSFLVPGVVMLAIMQNGFLNTTWSLFVTKLEGTLVDLLVAPLSPVEILIGYAVAAVARALLTGGIVWIATGLFAGFNVAHVGWLVAFAVIVAFAFAFAGVAVAIVSARFEQLNVMSTFVITPVAFLGGVFFSVHALPQPWRFVASLNPAVYLVDGFRFGMLGVAESSPLTGLAVAIVLLAGAGGVAWWMLASGYKLRK